MIHIAYIDPIVYFILEHIFFILIVEYNCLISDAFINSRNKKNNYVYENY